MIHSDTSAQRTGALPLQRRHSRRGRTGRAIGALVLREMSTTYGRSPGGWLWAFAEPVGTIALLSAAFSLAFLAPPLGKSFALFYATGYLPFMLYLDVSQKTATALRFSRPLLGFASVVWVDAVIARALLNTLTHLTGSAAVLLVLVTLSRDAVMPDPAAVGLAYAMALSLAVGVGLINASLFAIFPAFERLWTIASRPVFIVSGVVFLLESVPQPLRDWLALNPLFHITGEMRAATYPVYRPSYIQPVYVFAISAGLATVGALLLHRFHDRVAQP